MEHQAQKCLSDKDPVVVDLLGIITGQDELGLTAFIYFDEHLNSTAPVTNRVLRLKDAMTDTVARRKNKRATNSQSRSPSDST